METKEFFAHTDSSVSNTISLPQSLALGSNTTSAEKCFLSERPHHRFLCYDSAPLALSALPVWHLWFIVPADLSFCLPLNHMANSTKGDFFCCFIIQLFNLSNMVHVSIYSHIEKNHFSKIYWTLFIFTNSNELSPKWDISIYLCL